MKDEFYPTPKSLLDRIEHDFSDLFDSLPASLSLLEPSAGKGDMVEWIESRVAADGWRRGSKRFESLDADCIEIDRNLQTVLKGKEYRVVHDNFLSFDTRKHYDLILMNPPFSEGDKHLLKAIELQERYGGAIICILNAETIRNPFSIARKDLAGKLREHGAVIRYYTEAFDTADTERKTKVEIAVIGMNIVRESMFESSIIFDKLDKTAREQSPKIVEETDEETEVVPEGFAYLESYVKQYTEEVDAGIALMNEYFSFSHVNHMRFGDESEVLTLNLKGTPVGYDSINKYVETVRLRYWQALFENPKFVGKLTSKMRDDLLRNVREMKHYDFSIHNILVLFEQFRDNTLKGIEDSLMGLFDTFSETHSWIGDSSKNIHYYNGWKTNTAHKVNRKVILPMYGVWDAWRYGGKTQWSLHSWQAIDRLTDMAKALDYIADPVYSEIDTGADIRNQIQNAFQNGIATDIETKYFMLTFYKKGTCHITFKDLDLLERFNLYASRKRQWLPPDYGRKPYQAMSAEEKAVADSFSGGETEYNQIYRNQGKYLVERSNLLLLTAQS